MKKLNDVARYSKLARTVVDYEKDYQRIVENTLSALAGLEKLLAEASLQNGSVQYAITEIESFYQTYSKLADVVATTLVQSQSDYNPGVFQPPSGVWLETNAKTKFSQTITSALINEDFLRVAEVIGNLSPDMSGKIKEKNSYLNQIIADFNEKCGEFLNFANRIWGSSVTREMIRGTQSTVVSSYAGALSTRSVFGPDVRAVRSHIPIILLPVRIETIFDEPNDTNIHVLHIRIYPDDIHSDSHEPELTSDENDAGSNYHNIDPSDQDALLAAWINLVDRFGTERATWIVRQTRNGDMQTRDGAWTRPAQAKLLPSRWLVMGYDQNGDHLFDPVVGEPIPADLSIGPGPDNAENGGTTADWMLDLSKAAEVGMAVKIEFTGEEWENIDQNGIHRLLVVGLSEGDFADPQQGRKDLESLLNAHFYTDGLDFIPQGTPTNNYAIGDQDVRSGYRSSEPDYKESFVLQQRVAQNPSLSDDGLVLAQLLGLNTEDTILTFLASLDEQVSAKRMNYLVWNTFLDYSLRTILGNPWQQQYEAHSELWRSYFVNHVRALGPAPALRVGEQAYGVLPILSLDGRYGFNQYQQVDGVAEGINLIEILRYLRYFWLDILKVYKPGDINTMLWEWLTIHPLPTAINERKTELLPDISEIRDKISAIQPLIKNLQISRESSLNRLVFGDFITHGDTQEPSMGLVEEKRIENRIPYQEYIAKVSQALRNGNGNAVLSGDAQLLEMDHIPNTLFYKLLQSQPQNFSSQVNQIREYYLPFRNKSLSQLEQLLLETLGICSYRLDAWITSCATHRLATLRQNQATGCHIGAYGWVENLKPRPTTAENDYIFAPSAHHAATAAVLHNAHLSWDNGTGVYATDLSSRRIRLAKELLTGVSNKQSLSALLGYRVERRLQEAGLSDLIDNLRTLLNQNDAQTSANLGQHVLDGLKLRKYWQTNKDDIKKTYPQLEAIYAELEDAADAVEDLLRAEGVFNLISRNEDRAAANLDALSKGDQPPNEFHILHTPHPSISVTHRLLILFDVNRPHRFLWRRKAALSPRAQAEPQLNAWAEQLLGNLARVIVHVDVTLSSGAKTKQDISLAQISFAEQMCGLDVVYSVASGRFEEWLKYRIWCYLLNQNEFSIETVTYEFGRQANWSNLFLSMNEWIAIVQVYYELLKKSSAQPNPETSSKTKGLLSDSSLLDQTHLAYTQSFTNLNANIDDGKLQKRIDGVLKLISNTYNSIISTQEEIAEKTKIGLADQNQTKLYFFQLQEQIAQILGQYNLKTQFPLSQIMPTVLEEQTKWLATFNNRLTEIKMEIEKIIKDIEYQNSLEGKTSQLRQLLGESFVMLPIFSLSANVAAALSSAVEHRKNKGDATPIDIIHWLQATAKVQERAGIFNRLRQYANNISTIEANFVVAQFPNDSTRDVWLGNDPQYIEHDSLSIVAHLPGFTVPLTPDEWSDHSFAGVLIDAWTEKLLAPQLDKDQKIIIPPNHPAAMSVHYDQPGAVAPQAILVAVHRDDNSNWNFVDLEAVLLETMDLAQIRTVSSDDLEKTAISNFLPLLYLPTT